MGRFYIRPGKNKVACKKPQNKIRLALYALVVAFNLAMQDRNVNAFLKSSKWGISKGQDTFMDIPVNVLVLAKWLITNCSCRCEKTK